jgi:hypothetical protein
MLVHVRVRTRDGSRSRDDVSVLAGAMTTTDNDQNFCPKFSAHNLPIRKALRPK